jgi:hypothetical protein
LKNAILEKIKFLVDKMLSTGKFSFTNQRGKKNEQNTKEIIAIGQVLQKL